MKELSPDDWFLKENLFILFKEQLTRDFENTSLPTDFIQTLPSEFEQLKRTLLAGMDSVFKKNNSALQSLLYRIDISEQQIRSYTSEHSNLSFEETIVELIIKRILQKIILRKKFSP